MYHYISDYANTLAVPRALFDDQCRVLAENGWRGVSLAEAEAFFIHGEPLPEKSVLLTFDDGYLDNYLYALPVLRKYGHKGVMFAVSARLEEGDSPRVPLADVLEGTAPEVHEVNFPVTENALGFQVRRDVFCSRGEAQAMEASGIMAVASHSRGHLGVYGGPEFSDFVRPGHQPRTFYLTGYGRIWGMPDFTVKPGLQNRAFVPNPELVNAIKTLVPQEESAAAAFFADAGNVAALRALVDGFSEDMGRPETDAERRERMWEEIAGGKSDLEAVLGHPVRSLCWPWGKYGPEAKALACEAGFSVLFTTKKGVNRPGGSLAVHRFKGRPLDGAWLLSRTSLYARPWLGALYSKIHLRSPWKKKR